MCQLVGFEQEHCLCRTIVCCDEGSGAAAVAVLDCGDDVAARGKLGQVLCVVCARGGHAVGEYDDGEAVLRWGGAVG